MDRRRFIQAVTAGLVALSTPQVVDKGLEMIAKVSAEEKKPETVDDILAGNSFENVCSDNYSEKTKKGNVVVFFYDDDNGVDNASGRLAQVFKGINSEFKDDITFLKYKYSCDPSLSHNSYQGLRERFGVTGIPQVNFYENGKIIDTLEKGPSKGKEDIWVPWFNETLRKLYKI